MRVPRSLSNPHLTVIAIAMDHEINSKDWIHTRGSRIMTPDVTDPVVQAGVGGNTSYAAAGVTELGGSIGATSAENYLEFRFAPTVGYFVKDNIQVSAIGLWQHVNVKGSPAKNVGSILLEPSLHMPFDNYKFGFLGVGFGGIFQDMRNRVWP